MNFTEKLTYCTVYIKSQFADGSCSIGTGFVFNLHETNESCIPVVITNKHVVTGSEISTITFCKKNIDGSPNDKETVSYPILRNMWKNHPDDNVDLCACAIGCFIKAKDVIHAEPFYTALGIGNIPTQDDLLKFSAIEDLLMIGYPIGIADFVNNKPLVRKGISSTHINKDYQGNKEFLVDMACFPGSSGSPIFLLNQGSYTIDDNVYIGSRFFLVGILYGGPVYDAKGKVIIVNDSKAISSTQIPTNLGIAIKSERLKDFENIFK